MNPKSIIPEAEKLFKKVLDTLEQHEKLTGNIPDPEYHLGGISEKVARLKNKWPGDDHHIDLIGYAALHYVFTRKDGEGPKGYL